MRRWGGLLAAALAALAAGPAAAQQPPAAELPAFQERVEVRIVDVEVYVTDRAGQPVGGLEQEDFRLLADGRPVEIRNFYAEGSGLAGAPDTGGAQDRPIVDRVAPHDPAVRSAERPLFLTILVDHTRLAPTNRRRAFDAVEEMVRENLGPEDLVSVVSYDGRLVFHADFLYDRDVVARILEDEARTAARSAVGELERRQIIAELSRGQSGGFLGRTSSQFLEPDALTNRIRAWAAEEYHRGLASLGQLERLVATLAGLPGRKAVLYVSDGIPDRPGEELFNELVNRTGGGNPDTEPGLRRFDFDTDYRRAVGNYELTLDVQQLGDAANEAGVTIYALDAESDHAGDLRSAATEQGAISSSLSIAVDNFREPLELAARVTGGRRIQASGRLAQNLAGLADELATFYSLGFAPPEEWEPGSTHEIEVEVRGRGLVARHRERVRISGPDERAAQATVSTLLYQAGDNPLGVSLRPEGGEPRDDGATLLPVVVEIPVARLALEPRADTHGARLTFFVSVRDRAGDPGPVQKIPFHLEIPADRLDDALGRSAHYPLPLVVRPGDRQVAVGVRDEVAGTLSTLRLELDEIVGDGGRADSPGQ